MERLPLFERKFARNLALTRLEAINQAIKIHIESEKEPGFLTGMAGEALFLYEYGRFSGDSRAENLGFLALERTLTFISNGFSWPSFAAGLAGIRFALRHLAARNHISPADGAALDDINPLLSRFAADRFAAGDYDFLHGALGMYLTPYLLNPTQIIDPLHNSAIATAPGHLAWLSRVCL